jgi:monofunctional glycosyltransferase
MTAEATALFPPAAPPPTEPLPTAHTVRRRAGRHPILRALFLLLFAVVVFSQVVALVGFVLPIGAHTPDDTAFMRADPDGAIHPWVDASNISRDMLVALIAHEDAPFPDRTGAFSLHQFLSRAEAYVTGRPDPSGSTIDQQLAKNIWLTPSKTWYRKALEADLSTLMALSVPKARRLELYANTAQFGVGLYGVCAASWYYFSESPAMLDLDGSAQLVGLLPNPTAFRRAPAGGVDYHVGDGTVQDLGDTVAWARAHIIGQVRGVGGLRATEAIGITGTAQTHLGGVRCDVMPAEVRSKLVNEGFLKP